MRPFGLEGNSTSSRGSARDKILEPFVLHDETNGSSGCVKYDGFVALWVVVKAKAKAKAKGSGCVKYSEGRETDNVGYEEREVDKDLKK